MASSPTIVGDVSVEVVPLSGPREADLLMDLISALGQASKQGRKGYGAKMDFGPDVSCFLVAPSKISRARKRKIHVLKVSPEKYIVELKPTDEQQEAETEDWMTELTLKILEAMRKSGTLMTDEEDDREFEKIARLINEGERVAVIARQRLSDPKMG